MCSPRAPCRWIFPSATSRPLCANPTVHNSWSTPSVRRAVVRPCMRQHRQVSPYRWPAGFDSGLCESASPHAQRIRDVLHAGGFHDGVFGQVLHVALGHVAAQRNHAPGYIDLDMRGIDRIMQREPFANVLADAFVGTDIALGSRPTVAAGIARRCPAATLTRLRRGALVAAKMAMARMTTLVGMVAAEVAVAGVLPGADLVARFIRAG